MENILFPANVMEINQVLVDIASFEFFDSEKINTNLFHFPEEEPFNLSF